MSWLKPYDKLPNATLDEILGIDNFEDMVSSSAEAAFDEASATTGDSASGAVGQRAYHRLVEQLTSALREHGWKRHDKQNQVRWVSPGGDTLLFLASGECVETARPIIVKGSAADDILAPAEGLFPFPLPEFKERKVFCLIYQLDLNTSQMFLALGEPGRRESTGEVRTWVSLYALKTIGRGDVLEEFFEDVEEDVSVDVVARRIEGGNV